MKKRFSASAFIVKKALAARPMASLFARLYLSVFAGLCVCCFAGDMAFASMPVSPKSVVFLPNQVMVQVEQRITPVRSAGGALEYRLVIPDAANSDSFYATLDGQRLPFSWVKRLDWEKQKITDPAQETDEARKVLLEAYVKADKEKQELHSAIKGLEQSRAFWKSQAESQSVKEAMSAEQLTAIGAAVEKESRAIETALFEKKKALQGNERIWAKASEELARYDAAHTVKEVAIAALSQDEVRIDYSYVMPAVVKASYLVSAEPETGKFSLVQNVDLHQSSGIDWKDVDVSVAFVAKDYSLQPNPVRPWLLDYQEKADKAPQLVLKQSDGVAAQRLRSAGDALPKMANTVEVEVGYPPLVWQEEMASFRKWNLGLRDLAHDSATTLELASETYGATYFYTLRPENGRRGILTASLQFEKALELPKGWARCFVDDVYVGNQLLDINGKEARVYLGTDPQVTVDTREISMQKGEQGVFTKEQTREWHWNYTIGNSRSKAVDVVVEAAQPVSKDTSISITTQSRPEPEKILPTDPSSDPALKLYLWKKTLEPGEKFVIDHKVMVGATVGKELTSKNK